MTYLEYTKIKDYLVNNSGDRFKPRDSKGMLDLKKQDILVQLHVIALGIDKENNKEEDISKKVRILNKKIRNSLKYNLWRNKILIRDGYTCVLCRYTGNRLEVDHIKPFSEIVRQNKIISIRQAYKCKELWDCKNGRTLCRTCHAKTPSYMKRNYAK